MLDGRPGQVVRREVKGCARKGCSRANTPVNRLYRCLSSNCLACTWFCEECIVEAHRRRPLDKIEVWLNGEWQASTLSKLGLVINFGHWNGKRCRLTRYPVSGFVVIHTNGIHEVNVAFCNCAREKVAVRDQLLAARWYPATTDRPETAATFEVLDAFNAHSGSGKDNAYDFYRALETLTDGAGLHHISDRSKDFFRMAHQYRHLLALKRGGRGHDQEGIEKTAFGELAVICPACPHDGINTDVVDKLRMLSPELADAHELFNTLVQLSMDCNFRAKNRMSRSTPETSPYLGDGMAYMVPEQPYEDYTRTCLNDQELSSCSRFGAVVLANLKAGKGMRTTGVGALFCSRHEFFWPNCVGTLVKGERYSTMDFIFASALRRVRASSLHLYYDIVCQYTRNLNVRMLHASTKSFIGVGAVKLLHEINVSFGIPKFHNPGHLVICQLWFNLAYLRATGQTDGEASERAWAGLNPAASSLREMGPGTMRDTIDFYCGVWNWRKFISIGAFLTRKMEIAIREARDHCEIYTALYKLIREESPETAVAWVDGAVKWETRNALDALGQPVRIAREEYVVVLRYEANAYQENAEQSLEKARLESAELARLALKNSSTASSQAWRASRQVATNTILQKTERIEQRTELERQLVLFRKDQQWIMPLVFAAIQELEGIAGGAKSGGSTTVLYLPSELDRELARTEPMLEVMFAEIKLRLAGMEDWLDALRQQLRVRGTVTQWKISYAQGQRMATRTINKQRVIQENVITAREMYRLHRERYVTLISYLTEEERAAMVSPNWEETFQVLNDEDCRPLNNSLLLAIDAVEIEHVKQLVASRNNGVASGASSYRIPWIWYKVAEGTEIELNDDMRVEFVKCRARAMRWVEEVYKLAYEMARVPAFCTARASWWTARTKVVIKDADDDLQDGIQGYARKQATIFRRHAAGLEEHFGPSLQEAARFVSVFGLDGLIKTVL
ncbi:hypothetical protein PENSPDRAFT_578685 [Peniophora sp. CONT]|nr:hypothetical protein PENSPDRAFT_578685 [Peniophora sp. CONT]